MAVEKKPVDPVTLVRETLHRITTTSKHIHRELESSNTHSDAFKVNCAITYFTMMVDFVNSFLVQTTGRYYEVVCLHRMKVRGE